MMFRYLDIRTNPGYKYDVVLGDINYNFSLISGVTSALTSGAFLSLSGGTVSGTTIFSGNGANEILVVRNPDVFPSGQDSFQVWDGSNTKQLFIDSSNQFAFNAGTNGPLYFGTFANPSAGLGGFSAPNQVINNYSVNTIRMGVGGSGSYFAINDPKALFEARGKADEIQLIVQANNTQNQNIIEVRDASENPFAIVNTTGITSNLPLIVSGANMAIQNAFGMLELGENGQVEKSNVQQIQGSVQFTANAFYDGSWNQYNSTLPSWNMYLTPDGNDSMVVRRSAPSGISWVDLFKIDGTGVIYSAGTSLYDIFVTSVDGNDITRVQPGTNTYTGGTDNFPTVNISALTIDTLTVSGNSLFKGLTATTISATTFSGNSVNFPTTNLTDVSTNELGLFKVGNLEGATLDLLKIKFYDTGNPVGLTSRLCLKSNF
jgi:hypothetical protein